MSTETVAAGPDGVTLAIVSSAPPGTYLGFTYDGGGFGEPVPTDATWARPLPPGQVTVRCTNLHGGVDEAPHTLTVTDPDRHWRTTTLSQLGCPPGPIPAWTVAGSTGTKPQAAVDALVDHFRRDSAEPDLTATRAAIGYPMAYPQTWLLRVPSGRPHITATIDHRNDRYTAQPDAYCG